MTVRRFLHCNTYRFHGHHVGDIDRAYYRSKKEEEEWKTQRDPVKLLADWLQKNKMADGQAAANDRKRNRAERSRTRWISRLTAPYPPADEVDQHVYA